MKRRLSAKGNRCGAPGPRVLPARKLVGQPQGACSAGAAAPSRDPASTPGRPPPRPAPPQPWTPLVGALDSAPCRAAGYKTSLPGYVTPAPPPNPHPRARRRPGECDLEQSRGRACSAASIEPGNLTSQTSLIPDPSFREAKRIPPVQGCRN